jgi:hypothetical protein
LKEDAHDNFVGCINHFEGQGKIVFSSASALTFQVDVINPFRFQHWHSSYPAMKRSNMIVGQMCSCTMFAPMMRYPWSEYSVGGDAPTHVGVETRRRRMSPVPTHVVIGFWARRTT